MACWYSILSVSGASRSSTACQSTWISPRGLTAAWTSSRGGEVSTITRNSGRNDAPAETTVPRGLVREANQYSPSRFVRNANWPRVAGWRLYRTQLAPKSWDTNSSTSIAWRSAWATENGMVKLATRE